jgi:hypothetical protein
MSVFHSPFAPIALRDITMTEQIFKACPAFPPIRPC